MASCRHGAFRRRSALISKFLLIFVLLYCESPAWMSALAEALLGSGATFLLLGELAGMTTASLVITMLVWAPGAATCQVGGWPRDWLDGGFARART